MKQITPMAEVREAHSALSPNDFYLWFEHLQDVLIKKERYYLEQSHEDGINMLGEGIGLGENYYNRKFRTK